MMKNFWLLAFLLLSPGLLLAQQTGITGKVTDPSGATVVGASVVVKENGGATFKETTNSQGIYEVPSLTAAGYTVTVASQGFETVEKKLTLLVGQLGEVDIQLPLAGASASVVVESEAIAVDTTSSEVAGNVTPREVQGLPINGRNYMELATLVPGVRVNAITNFTPLGTANTGKFQIILDGLQVTQDTADPFFGQPQFSQDAISQFQIVTNRFDATLGRSAGIYVNVQTKSGSNDLHGTAFGYFRNSFFNASDPIAHRVLPFSDQEYGGTVGGPIRKDKLWYFASFEGEHQPSTAITTPSYVGSTQLSHPATLSNYEYLGRGDYQPNDKNHILARGDAYTFSNNYLGVGGNTDPSVAYAATRMSYGLLGSWNMAVSPRFVNNLDLGFNHFQWENINQTNSPQIHFPTITVGGPYNYPQRFHQNTQQYRDDAYYLRGKHSFKAGVEYLFTSHTGYFQQNVRGAANCGSNPANFAAAFPNTGDPTTWNYTLINQACAGGAGESYVQGFGNFALDIPRNQIGLWAEDDWKIFSRFTLNLGLRYDNDLGVYNTGLKLNNGVKTPTSNDNHEFAPRIGFAWDPTGTGKTVIRGGAGMYFADVAANQVIDEQIFNGVTTIQASITGNAAHPIDLRNPFNGASSAQILANPAAYKQAIQPLAPQVATPWALQMSAGVQREIGSTISVAADYVHTRVYHDWVRQNTNLLLNPATGYNLNPFANGGKNVPLPAFTQINTFETPNAAGSIYDGLQVGIRKVLSHGLSAGVAYTLSRFKDSTESPFYFPNNPFNVHAEWANSADDQRNTLAVNGEYLWKYGLALSTIYHFGSGAAFPTFLTTQQPTGYFPSYNRTFSAPPCALSPVAGCAKTYNPVKDLSLDPVSGFYLTRRDALYGRNIQRVDTRLQETVPIKERYRVIVAVEAFNLFNHSNYGSYNGIINSPGYGTPLSVFGGPVEYQARSLQFVGRFEF